METYNKSFDDETDAYNNAMQKIKTYDEYTYQHCLRVGKYAMAIAKEMGENEETLEIVKRAGELHDIGKIRVPIGILKNENKLTKEEYEIIRMHLIYGIQELNALGLNRPEYIEVAGDHHTWRDSKGPVGSKRSYRADMSNTDEPSKIVSIITIADTYDTLSHPKDYE